MSPCEGEEQGSRPEFTLIMRLWWKWLDTAALEAVSFGSAGSSPARRTNSLHSLIGKIPEYESGDVEGSSPPGESNVKVITKYLRNLHSSKTCRKFVFQ